MTPRSAPETLAHGFSLPRGRRLRRALRSDPTQEYLLCVPEDARPGAPVLVSVHGISRNVEEHSVAFAPLCAEHGAILVVPMFTKEMHADYQRLGRQGRGERVDLLLHRMLAEVAHLTDADTSRFSLFGFSAGAQFAHRHAMAHPHRVRRVVAAAAGWYTFPDGSRKYPHGIRPTRALGGVVFHAEEFLRVPIQVLVGDRDTSSTNLRRSERVRMQGATRLERAQNWVAAMQARAEVCRIPSVTTLRTVRGLGHSFAKLARRAEVMADVGRFLLEGSDAENKPVDATASCRKRGAHRVPVGSVVAMSQRQSRAC